MQENQPITPQESNPELERQPLPERKEVIPYWITPLEAPIPRNEEMMEHSTTLQSFSNIPPSLAAKLNEKHIDTLLDMANKEGERAYKTQISTKVYRLIYFLIGVAAIVIVLAYMVQLGVLSDVLNLIFSFVGGLGVGYTAKSYFDASIKGK